jgi:hypothetical protein
MHNFDVGLHEHRFLFATDNDKMSAIINGLVTLAQVTLGDTIIDWSFQEREVWSQI